MISIRWIIVVVVTCCLGGSICSSHARCQGLQETKPIGHWTLDETVDGKIQNLVKGKIDNCLRFDGKDDFIELGDMGQHKAVTMSFWIKPESVQEKDKWQGLMSSDDWQEGVLHIALRAGSVHVYLHQGGGSRTHITSSPLRNGSWYHIAVVADTEHQTLALYTNGFEDVVAQINLATPIKLLRQVIGRENTDEAKRYYQGCIDDARIYSTALTGEEVRMLCPRMTSAVHRDWRDIRNGNRIPDEGYCDQPYVIVTPDGNWLCTLTTGSGHEGAGGQHVVSTISTDKGRSWSKLVDIEPASGPAASWVVPLLTQGGRIYAFYTFNGDKVANLNGKRIRNDMLGWYCYRYSDDSGRSWSQKRYRLPMRATACDRSNDWQGKVIIFWGICKPLVVDEKVYFSFTKMGRYMMKKGEGWLYCSDNLLSERDQEKIKWDLRPEGEQGIRKQEFGSVQEEHNLVSLGSENLYCVYRTTEGFPCHTYSDDGGRTWLEPEPMTYTPGGRRMKTPRACPKIWQCKNGNYLFWFHNHGGKSFEGRNPVWISGGILRDGKIHWSQPEILLYDKKPKTRMSYPDLIEQDGKYWVTETQKTVARTHLLDKTLLESMWNQTESKTVAREGLVLDVDGRTLTDGKAILSTPIDVAQTAGASIDLRLRLDNLDAGQVVYDCRDKGGHGMALTTTVTGTLRLDINDGQNTGTWDCDPGLLSPGKWHHITVIVDDGPKIIMFVVDGVLCNGANARQRGWGRYSDHMRELGGDKKPRVGLNFTGQVGRLRVYSRALRVSETVGNYQAVHGS